MSGGPTNSRPRPAQPLPRIRPKRKGAHGGSPDDDGCDLEFAADLQGINKDTLDRISVGSVLNVQLVPKGQAASIVCVAQGQIVGTLAGFPGLAALRNCMEIGNNYEAHVLQKSRGTCNVLVRRSSA